MRLPRVQFTVRRMMIAVAILAVIAGAGALRQRRHRLQRLATQHGLAERQIRDDLRPPGIHERGDILGGLRRQADKGKREADEARPKWAEAEKALASKLSAGLSTTQAERREPWYWKLRVDEGEWEARAAEREIAFHESRIGYHVRMRRAYERAASRPWVSVAVEPPVAEVFTPSAPFRPTPPPP